MHNQAIKSYKICVNQEIKGQAGGSVKEMLKESKEMNDGDEKETRKRRSKQAGKKVTKKKKMEEEGNERKLVQNREKYTKYM